MFCGHGAYASLDLQASGMTTQCCVCVVPLHVLWVTFEVVFLVRAAAMPFVHCTLRRCTMFVVGGGGGKR